VDLGDVLRVPRPALEEMLGAELPATPPTKHGGGRIVPAANPAVGDPAPIGTPRATPRTGRHPPQPTHQLPLFEPVPTSPPDPQRTSRA
jgi:hypothetical protein